MPAHRALESVAGGDTDDGVARQRCWGRTGRSQHVVAIDQINHPRWLSRRRHQRVQLVLIHHGIDPFLPREAPILGEGILVDLIG